MEAGVGEESECEASTEEDSEAPGELRPREGPRSQALPNHQNRNPARHRDDPVTAANVTVTDWERVEAISVDEHEGIV
jgi:hypothetical protein